MSGYVTYKDGTGDTVPDGFTWITNHLQVSPAVSVAVTGGHTLSHQPTNFLRVAFEDGFTISAETGYGNLLFFLAKTEALHALPMDWFGETLPEWVVRIQGAAETIRIAFGQRR